MSEGLLEHAKTLGTAYEVAMNEIKFMHFGENGLRSIGTANLNGCSIVIVLSNFGAILGHIAPLPYDHAGNPTAGDEHAQSKMKLLKSLYMSNKQYFPNGSEGCVVCAMLVETGVGLPDQQKIFQKALTDLHLPCSLKTYIAAEKSQKETPGKGTVLIQGNGNNPRVYIEDIEVTIRDRPDITVQR